MGPFFGQRQANEWVFRFARVPSTVTPIASLGVRATPCITRPPSHIDRLGGSRGPFIDTLTVEEYRALSPSGRRFRRTGLYRHPLVMFGLGAEPIVLQISQRRALA